MAIRSITQLKTWFRKGAYPLASQFADWMDSYWHKDEKMPIDAVDQLADRLNGKYDAAQANELQKQVAGAVEKADAVQKDIDVLYKNIEELEAEDERLETTKVDKIEGKGLSAEDFTTALRQKLEGLNNYDDTIITQAVQAVQKQLDTLLNGNVNGVIDAFNEIEAFLSGITDTQTLTGLLADLRTEVISLIPDVMAIVIDPLVAGYETTALNVVSLLDAGKFPAVRIIDADGTHLVGSVIKTSTGYLLNTDYLTGVVKDGIATLRQRRFSVNATTGAISTEQFKPLQNLLTKDKFNAESKIALTSLSYAELVALRDSKQLRPGHHYRITDFVTTVANDAEARSAGHPFDIIVLATAADTLSEEARAIVNENYAEYFATANLSAWEVWYCLDNDTTRFQWADEANGRGVIYRLIDEWRNDCPYDFKNIQFKRCLTGGSFVEDVVDDIEWGNTHYILSESMGNFSNMNITDNSDVRWLYTFTRADNPNLDNLCDASLSRFAIENEVGAYFNKACNCNTMKPYYTSEVVDDTAYVVQALNNIVLSSYDEGNGDAVKIYGNTWDIDCYNMTFHDHAYCNTFGNECCSTVGFEFCWNTLGAYCWHNTFGNNLQYITVHNDVRQVDVAGAPTSGSYVQNAQILNGTSGSSSSNRLQISFKANVKYCQFAGLNSSGILKIWTPADLV